MSHSSNLSPSPDSDGISENALPAQDMAMAQAFFDIVAEGEQVTFQTFADSGSPRRELTRILHGDINQCAAELIRLNNDGAGIFWLVNRGDGKGRRTENIASVRAVFVDLDGAPLQPVLAAAAEPHVIVETSPGRWHAYWLVGDCELAEFGHVQRALASKFGGDRSVHDLPRVLRVPGFLHSKSERFLSRIERLVPRQPYALRDLVEQFGLGLAPAPQPTTRARLEANGSNLVEKVMPGGRHEHLVRWAGRLNWRGIPHIAIRTALHEENRSSCDPPVSDERVDSIVNDIIARYADQHGRDLAPQTQQSSGTSNVARDPNSPGAPELLFKDVDLSQLMTSDRPPQAWWWDGYLPAGQVTLLGGHGGTGKSTLALMLAASLASTDEFLGKKTRLGRVLFFSGEDPEPLVLQRLAKICKAMSLDVDSVRRNLRIVDATDSDPVLFSERRVAGVRSGTPTMVYKALEAYLEEHQIDVLIVDNASDVFDGEEINRAMVSSFIRSLARLVRKRNGAALLLSHVDKLTSRAGRTPINAESYSGSTAWHNSVRSRLFLFEREPGTLELQHQKSNLGLKQEPLVLNWPAGDLPRLDAAEAIDLHSVRQVDAKDTLALLKLVHEYTARGEFVGTARSSPASPARLFVYEPTYPRKRKPTEVLQLLREAERFGLVDRENYKTADRKSRERWSLTAEGCQAIGVAPAAPTAPTAPRSGPDMNDEHGAREVRHVHWGVRGVARAHEPAWIPNGLVAENQLDS